MRTGLPAWVTFVVFGVAFLARVAFWQATPDRQWPHSAAYKGDAVVWSNYSAALERGERFELGLPLRPPGNGYLLSWLGVRQASDVAGAKLVWCLLGALAVTLFYRVALAALGAVPALLTALWCAFSTALLILSTSLNNETPYLVLVGLLLILAPRQPRARSGPLLLWGLLHGLACLVRVEHALFVGLAALWWWLAARGAAPGGDDAAATDERARRSPAPTPPLRGLILIAAGFGAALLPWHLSAWHSIREFNDSPQPLNAAAESAQSDIERALSGIAWTPAAERERDALPAFARRSASNFVAATVAWRGGRQVTATDFEILEQAFGSRPEALAEHPFVALYGPLNFFLAHRVDAPPGFDAAGLDRPPPLSGGAARYPAMLVAGLPPQKLNFSYPPHVEIVNRGYRLGLRAIAAAPGQALRRTLARLDIAWQGASLGWTGYGLPWGLEGVRRAVDLTVPQGAGFAVWRALLALICCAALWRLRRRPLVWLWAFFLLHKLAAAGLFFGYARHGATLVPVVALLVAALVGAALGTRVRRVAHIIALVAGLALAVEGWRWLEPPQLVLDGRTVGVRDPFPADDHRVRELTAQ